MRLDGQQVLVTGSEGFIGSHLTEQLVHSGCRVRAMVLYNSFNNWGWLEHLPRDIIKEIEVIPGDIRDHDSVSQAMRGCAMVFHLAALIAIPYSYLAPSSYVATNVQGTLNVLVAARDQGLERVVQTSTSEVYGTAVRAPIDEEHPLAAQSPYAATKIAADQLALSFQRSFELPVTVVRPFNTYGPRQSARAAIPTIIGQLAAGAKELRLGALHPTRDFSFVSDTVAGFLAVGANDDCVSQVVNIGSGFEISIGELAQTISDVMGVEATVSLDPDRLRPKASEVERLLADAGKARRLAGWQPEYAGQEGLRRGLAITAAWFQDKTNLALYKTDIYNR